MSHKRLTFAGGSERSEAGLSPFAAQNCGRFVQYFDQPAPRPTFSLLVASVMLLQVYARMTMQRRSRAWLNNHLIDRWLKNGRY
jgi:hypothetical protein